MEWNDNIDDPQGQLTWLGQIIRKNPQDGHAHYKLAEVYEYMNQDAEAAQYCRKAAELDPVNSLYWAFLVFLTIRLDSKKAFAALERLIETVPDEGDYNTQRVIDELAYVDCDFAVKYISELRRQGREDVARVMERWIWNP